MEYCLAFSGYTCPKSECQVTQKTWGKMLKHMAGHQGDHLMGSLLGGGGVWHIPVETSHICFSKSCQMGKKLWACAVLTCSSTLSCCPEWQTASQVRNIPSAEYLGHPIWRASFFFFLFKSVFPSSVLLSLNPPLLYSDGCRTLAVFSQCCHHPLYFCIRSLKYHITPTHE